MIRYTAPAKINLYFHITGRRDDGYHYLDSLVSFVEGVGDSVTITPATEFRFTVTGAHSHALQDTPMADNLVVRAAHNLAAITSQPLNCRIHLEKHLPIASGIGGGSSDAAATMLALAKWWGIAPDTLPLPQLARQLGQDVVACLYRQSCAFSGIGDEVRPVPPLPPVAIMLANPMVAVPTPAVFKARTGAFSPAAPLMPWPADFAALIAALRQRHNDLYAPASRIAPIITSCLQHIAATPACAYAAMSGSGATCFGLYPTNQAAKLAAQQLAEQQPAWWIATGELPFIGNQGEKSLPLVFL